MLAPDQVRGCIFARMAGEGCPDSCFRRNGIQRCSIYGPPPFRKNRFRCWEKESCSHISGLSLGSCRPGHNGNPRIPVLIIATACQSRQPMELTGFQECRPYLSCHYRQSSVHKLLGVLLLNSLICQCRWVFGLTNHAQTALRRNGVVHPVVFAFLQQRPGRPRLKHDYRWSRNWLKGSSGNAINLWMVACAWNLRKWMIALFLSQDSGGVACLVLIMVEHDMCTVQIVLNGDRASGAFLISPRETEQN